jgi:hypothetical protein
MAKGDLLRTYGDERWRIADQTAAFLQVDRDVCRRAFYEEPLGLVSEVVEAVRSWEDDPDYDPENLIESWARNEGAGVYDEERRHGGGLVPLGVLVGDQLLRLALNRPKLDGEYDYHLYLACMRLEEDKLGRQLTASELDRFTRSFYAPSYRRDLETIPREVWDQLDSELEEEAPASRQKRPPRRKAG